MTPCVVLFTRCPAPGRTKARLASNLGAGGGCSLLGLRSPTPFLFDAMPRGTARVFALTEMRLAGHGVIPAVPPVLANLDRPEDLVRWPGVLP